MKKHFLVVDDSELNLRVVSSILDRFGISADYVKGADAAFTKLSERDYDLVLIDYLMPVMNGDEVTRLIRKINGIHQKEYFGRLPIVMLTAEEKPEMVEHMMKCGANAVLTKPLRAEAMKDVMGKLLPRVHGIEDEVLDAMMEDDLESFLELVDLFCGDIPEKRGRIEDALAISDYQSYTVEVHRIKSECKILGANELADTAKELEFAGKAITSDAENKLLIEENTPRVLHALDTMLIELRALTAESDGSCGAEDEPECECGSRSGSDHETGTEASSQAGEVKTELERILRYTAHAEEAFAEGDHSLAREWITEIRDALKALIG